MRFALVQYGNEPFQIPDLVENYKNLLPQIQQGDPPSRDPNGSESPEGYQPMKSSQVPFRRDRRITLRHGIKTPVRIKVWKSLRPEAAGESINISQRGMFFSSDAVFRAGETVEIFFEMPQEIGGAPVSEWRCTGHIVRTESIAASGGRLGIGVQFDCYEVARSTPSNPLIQTESSDEATVAPATTNRGARCQP